MIATITEPTTNDQGGPLADLFQTLAFVNMVNHPLQHHSFPASSPAGGGKHIIPLDGLTGPIIVQAISIDVAGNQSTATIVEVDIGPGNPAPSPPKIEVA